MSKLTFITALIFLLLACQPKELILTKATQNSPTQSLLQAISIVDEYITWVSGHDATILRTVDGGLSWDLFSYDQVDSLQFRDIHAFDDSNIVLMSAGPGAMSRIFLFNIHHGFTETYLMPHPEGFLNSIEFWDDQNGLAFGDSFNNELFILKTNDGGKSWSQVDPRILPKAGKGEGGFAASGTCISLRPNGKAWVGTGAGGNSRVLFSDDYGKSWAEYQVPMIKGDAAGITSIRMFSDQEGLIVGGDLEIKDSYTDNIALTTDGGKTWSLTNQPITKGAFYGSDFLEFEGQKLIVAAGPNGIDYSWDMGKKFENLDIGNYWAIDFVEAGYGFAVGTEGKILKLSFQ